VKGGRINAITVASGNAATPWRPMPSSRMTRVCETRDIIGTFTGWARGTMNTMKMRAARLVARRSVGCSYGALFGRCVG